MTNTPLININTNRGFQMNALWNEDRYNEEEDVYGESSRHELVEDDEMSAEEAGFMQGYMEA